MPADIAIIGGTGLSDFCDSEWREIEAPNTPYGVPSAPLRCRNFSGSEVVFLPRHGDHGRIAPHLINYRANIAALKSLGVRWVIAVNAVGGLNDLMEPSTLVVPDQIIDYSYGREQSFCDGRSLQLRHVDFTSPYSHQLRQVLLKAATAAGLECRDSGVYGCTQGPRLETAAEIRRCIRDGCDLVGMTGMPEAALARELEMEYASLCLVVNWGAGLNCEPISMQAIGRVVAGGNENIRHLLLVATELLAEM